MAAESVAAAVFKVWCRTSRGGTDAAFGRRPVPPLPRWTRGIPVRGPAGAAGGPAAGMARRRPAARRAGRRARELRDSSATDPAAWRWGALHRLTLVHPLGSIPGWSAVRAADAEVGGDEQTVMQGGFDGRAATAPSSSRRGAPSTTWRTSTARRRAAVRRVRQPRLGPLERPVAALDGGGAHPLPFTRPRWKRPRSPRCAWSPGNIGPCRSPGAHQRRPETPLPARAGAEGTETEAQPAVVRPARARPHGPWRGRDRPELHLAGVLPFTNDPTSPVVLLVGLG